MSFCLPPGSYRLTFCIFSDGEGTQSIRSVSLGNQCENYTKIDVSQSEICYIIYDYTFVSNVVNCESYFIMYRLTCFIKYVSYKHQLIWTPILINVVTRTSLKYCRTARNERKLLRVIARLHNVDCAKT